MCSEQFGGIGIEVRHRYDTNPLTLLLFNPELGGAAGIRGKGYVTVFFRSAFVKNIQVKPLNAVGEREVRGVVRLGLRSSGDRQHEGQGQQ